MIPTNYCPPEVPESKAKAIFRMHWITRMQTISSGVLLIALGIWLYILAPFVYGALGTWPYVNLLLLISSLCVLFGWGIASYFVMLYYLTVATLTDNLLVDVDQTSLFSRKVSTLNLEQIQDVTVRQVGMFSTFFNYGDVVVQTAGELPEFIFDNVPDPQGIANKILEAQQKISS